MRWTRRDFLSLSAALLAGCGSASNSSETPVVDNRSVDVAIIGAGAAGIGAGRALARQGRSFTILEARDRIGGRCYCDNTTFPGIAFDVGGQWFHQVTPLPEGGTTNALYDLALQSRLSPELDDGPRLLYSPPVNILDTQAVDTLVAIGAAVVAAAAPALTGDAPDPSFAQATASVANLPYYDLVSGLLVPGANLAQTSVLDFVPLGFTGSPVVTPSLDNYLIESGLGNFLARLAEGLPVQLSTQVQRITWGGSSVTLQTNRGTLTARRVIITVPVSVLNAGRVEFSPPLPGEHRDALGAVRLTDAAKIALHYDRRVFDVPERNTFAIPVNAQSPHVFVQTNAWSKDYAVVICGGPEVPELERRGALVDYAVGIVSSMFPAATRDKLLHSAASAWSTDPLALGAFSYVIPGSQGVRDFLTRPVGNQLYFAGEAISEDAHSSVHGAFASGERAALLT